METQSLAFWKGVFDDSGTGGGREPVFVFAGYLAPAPRWEAFAVEWQGMLDRYHLSVFKMAEANDRWLKRGELEPLMFFYRVIERHAWRRRA